MRSRMTPEQLAKLRAATAQANEDRALAQAANGHGVTNTQKEKARAELVERHGKRGANRLQEAELQSAGARPKLLSKARWFG